MQLKSISPKEIVDAFKLIPGERALIASDLMEICWAAEEEGIHFDINELISLFQKAVGSEGTLLFPVYNWGFCKGKTFDYKKTRSKTGSLGQVALGRKDFRRTRHPIYSFAVWGKDTDELYAMNDSNSFKGNTPFDYLYRTNAKMLMINVQHCITFVHYVEECVGVDYRFRKNFTSDYIDESGEKTTRTYSMFVRYLDERAVEGRIDFEDFLIESGILKKNIKKGYSFYELEFVPLFEIVRDDILINGAKRMIY